MVTSHGVGMAVPDWPNTYGYNMFLFPYSQWVGGIFYEHSHRLVGTVVGMLTAILAAWMWMREARGRVRWAGFVVVFLVVALLGVRKMPVYVTLASLAIPAIAFSLWQFRKNPAALRWLGMTALAAVVLQGVLGGLRVVWLKDELGIFHATLAQLFFVLICALGLMTSRWWKKHPITQSSNHPITHKVALAVTVLILLQLILGATMRHQHAGLAIPDFPLAYGKIWPDTGAEAVARYNRERVEVYETHAITALQIILQMAHRLMAAVILAGVGIVAFRCHRRTEATGAQTGTNPTHIAGREMALRRLGFAWFGLILIQAALGGWTIWSNKAADVATAHVLVGALSLVTGAQWCVIAFRRPE